MQRGVVCNVLAALVLAATIGSPSAWALDPGTYTVQCAPLDSVATNGATFDLRMDMVDLLTMKYTFGAVISGTRVDGSRVILTGDRGCSLVEVRGRSTK
jgi:hypothetical protein